MKKINVIILLVFMHLLCHSQNLDLIVTNEGDSIACKIDSITNNNIHFGCIIYVWNGLITYMRAWEKTNILLCDVADYQKNIIKRKNLNLITFFNRPESPYILKPYTQEHLEDISAWKLNFYLNQAIKLQKRGVAYIIVGSTMLGAATTLILKYPYMEMWEGSLVILGGMAGFVGLTGGIVMNVVGKKRVEQINSILTLTFHDISFDIHPDAQYNLITQNYQPAVTLRVRF